MASSNGLPFQYSLFPAALQTLQEFGRLAQQRGFGPDFARDIRVWTNHLRTDPTGWGDPLYNFHKLGMTYFRGHSDYLYTYFCVHPAAHRVIVQRLVADPYSALA